MRRLPPSNLCFAVLLLALVACTSPGPQPEHDEPATKDVDTASSGDLGTTTNDGDNPISEKLPRLRAEAGHFRDGSDAVVVLRGLNVAGNSKVPPFLPLDDVSQLDPLQQWGVNVIRLVFTWEAYEPTVGDYQQAYLDQLTTVVEGALDRGIYVIVDFHQDGFSRFLADGCGDGFPKWAVPKSLKPDTPDNGHNCATWGIKMTLDSDVHKAFSDFYADSDGVRGRYLKLFGRLAEHFAKHPAVLGYDLINEPWGWETSEIGPLYEAVAKVIRATHPKAILFIEGHVTTNGGAIQTLLDKPKFDNFAYAPHFYDAAMLASHAWSGLSTVTDVGFQNMRAKAKQWNVPLFIGEFGAHANTIGGAAYMDLQYQRLDETFASAAQWNYTPGWTPANKDGWNDEDLSVIDNKGMLRANYRVRPYPSQIAGQPIAFVETADLVSLTWQHRPAAGVTTVFVPVNDLWPGNDSMIETKGDGLSCQFDDMSRYVTCTSQTEVQMNVTIRKEN